MKWLRQLIYLFAMCFAAAIPAAVQLNICGFTQPAPPVDIPFEISASEAQKRTEPIVWVDARPESIFQVRHVPGALNLNRTNWEQALPRLFASYAPGRTVIVYCSPDCLESQEIASRIRNLGFDQVLFLRGGFEAWQKINQGL